MPNNDTITLRNKTTGELVTVPRSQYIQAEPTNGFGGIGQDITNSFLNTPEAALSMIPQIISGAGASVKRAATNPAAAALDRPAGVIEGAAAIHDIPRNIADYLAQKGLISQKTAERLPRSAMPTIKGMEGALGIGDQNEGDRFMKMISSFLVPGKAAEMAGGGMLPIAGANAALATGENQDPVQAALMTMIGHKAGQVLNKSGVAGKTADVVKNIPEAVRNIPQTATNAIGQIPEMVGSTAGSVLETAADYGSKIPGAGAILQPTIGALASYLKHISVAPEEMARRKLFADITPADLPKMQERMDAAKRLGISFLTPGEALLSPFQTAKEANVGRTSGGARLLYEKGKERVGTEAKAIDNLLDTIYDEKQLDPQKKAEYENAMASTVPPEFIEKWKQDPVVEDAIKLLKNKSTYKRAVRNMPEDSFKYWNVVKRVIGDMEKGDVSGMQKFSSDQATQARNEMVDEMDAINPRYETARNIAEREFTRKDLEDVFDKKEMTLNNFWSFLKSDKQFNKVIKKLDAFPEAQQKLKDIRLLSNEMIPFDDSIRTAYKLEKTGMTKDRNKLDALKRDLDERFGQEHDVAAVKLMTDPDLMAKLTEYLRKK